RDAGLLARIHDDPRLVPALVEESLRLEPAAAAVDRYATVDIDIRDARIRSGDFVRVSLAAANRDPEVFDTPDRFAIDRPDARRHLAFAAGPHLCIGLMLARIETVAAVESAVAGLPALRLDEDRSDPPTGLVFRKPQRLTARWD
ncbi:MAG: cytochrome P450, partial [Actinomycetota bacterium]